VAPILFAFAGTLALINNPKSILGWVLVIILILYAARLIVLLLGRAGQQ
jgi:hypothetical protein